MSQEEPDISMDRYIADFKSVVKFLSYLKLPTDVFPTLYSEPNFKWKITANPFGKSACYLRRQGVIPAAHCSITAKPINPWLGIGAGCGELGDTHTHPSFQRQGHFRALGSHVIQDFEQSEPRGEKLIYGFPNDLALPGWTRHCDCVVFKELSLIELERSARRAPLATARAGLIWTYKAMGQSSKRLHLCTDDAQTTTEIDRLWSETYEKETYLLKKDGAWWKWRYASSTENYKTYALREMCSDRLQAYIVVKVSRRGLRYARLRHIHLCEIFGKTFEHAVEAFQLFVKTLTLPFDALVFWTQSGTRLANVAMEYGFVKRRDIPVIFFKNRVFEQLRARGNRIKIVLGDSDNA